MGNEVIKIKNLVGGDNPGSWAPAFREGESAYLLCTSRKFKNPVELSLMWSVKHAVDPEGRMNPGKVLPALPL